MEAKAVQKYIRMSPRKLRLVAAITKKLAPTEAIRVLPLVNKRAAEPLGKAVKAAIANAVAQGANPEQLIFKEIQIGEGPILKRGRPVSRGNWHPIQKKMSHIRVVVTTKSEK